MADHRLTAGQRLPLRSQRAPFGGTQRVERLANRSASSAAIAAMRLPIRSDSILRTLVRPTDKKPVGKSK